MAELNRAKETLLDPGLKQKYDNGELHDTGDEDSDDDDGPVATYDAQLSSGVRCSEAFRTLLDEFRRKATTPGFLPLDPRPAVSAAAASLATDVSTRASWLLDQLSRQDAESVRSGDSSNAASDGDGGPGPGTVMRDVLELEAFCQAGRWDGGGLALKLESFSAQQLKAAAAQLALKYVDPNNLPAQFAAGLVVIQARAALTTCGSRGVGEFVASLNHAAIRAGPACDSIAEASAVFFGKPWVQAVFSSAYADELARLASSPVGGLLFDFVVTAFPDELPPSPPWIRQPGVSMLRVLHKVERAISKRLAHSDPLEAAFSYIDASQIAPTLGSTAHCFVLALERLSEVVKRAVAGRSCGDGRGKGAASSTCYKGDRQKSTDDSFDTQVQKARQMTADPLHVSDNQWQGPPASASATATVARVGVQHTSAAAGVGAQHTEAKLTGVQTTEAELKADVAAVVLLMGELVKVVYSLAEHSLSIPAELMLLQSSAGLLLSTSEIFFSAFPCTGEPGVVGGLLGIVIGRATELTVVWPVAPAPVPSVLQWFLYEEYYACPTLKQMLTEFTHPSSAAQQHGCSRVRALYYSFVACWQGYLEGDAEAARVLLLEELLQRHGWSMNDVSNLISGVTLSEDHAPFVARTREGWQPGLSSPAADLALGSPLRAVEDARLVRFVDGLEITLSGDDIGKFKLLLDKVPRQKMAINVAAISLTGTGPFAITVRTTNGSTWVVQRSAAELAAFSKSLSVDDKFEAWIRSKTQYAVTAASITGSKVIDGVRWYDIDCEGAWQTRDGQQVSILEQMGWSMQARYSQLRDVCFDPSLESLENASQAKTQFPGRLYLPFWPFNDPDKLYHERQTKLQQWLCTMLLSSTSDNGGNMQLFHQLLKTNENGGASPPTPDKANAANLCEWLLKLCDGPPQEQQQFTLLRELLQGQDGRDQVLQSCDDALLSQKDVDLAIQTGGLGVVFTLNPPTPESMNDHAPIDMRYHPAQQCVFSPAEWQDSTALQTELQCDYVLKELTTFIEVSAHAPFNQRAPGIDSGMFTRLPPELLQYLREPLADRARYERSSAMSAKGCAHRFWIEADPVPILVVEDDGNQRIYCAEPRMRVLQHLLKHSPDGSVADDDTPENDELHAEAEFARRLTEKYDEVARYFPEFQRLREIAKLCALSTRLHGYSRGFAHIFETLTVEGVKPDVVMQLGHIREQITQWPICTESRVQELVDECLRQNGVSRWSSNLAPGEIGRIERHSQDQLRAAESDTARQIAELLGVSNHTQLVRKWLDDGPSHSQGLVDVASIPALAKKKGQCKRAVTTFAAQGIDISNTEGVDFAPHRLGKCSWVPAVISTCALARAAQHRVYGGVNLMRGCWDVSSDGGGSGGGSSGGSGGGSSGGSGGGSSGGGGSGGGSSGGSGGGSSGSGVNIQCDSKIAQRLVNKLGSDHIAKACEDKGRVDTAHRVGLTQVTETLKHGSLMQVMRPEDRSDGNTYYRFDHHCSITKNGKRIPGRCEVGITQAPDGQTQVTHAFFSVKFYHCDSRGFRCERPW
jgi:hypothetical protein